MIQITKYYEGMCWPDSSGGSEFLANNAKPEYVLCAAIWFKDGKEYVHQPKNIESGFVICGRRHHNCVASNKAAEMAGEKGSSVLGFLTSKDRFLTRKEAGELAFTAKQISEPNNCLFSEDLY